MGHRTKWPGNNPEKVKELWQKYHEEREKKKVYNQIELDCAVCGCKVKKNKWARHVRSEKHRKVVERGGGDGKDGGRECELKGKYFDTFILAN